MSSVSNVQWGYRTSDGYQTSVAGDNIVESLDPNATVGFIKTFSLWVDSDCKVILNDDEIERSVTNRLGMNYTTDFVPVKSLKFTTSGVSYFIAYGV